MNQETAPVDFDSNRYLQDLKAQAIAAAESHFDAVAIECQKNVLLMKKKTSTFTNKPFFTIKVNYHDIGFHDGHYDIAFDEAVDNFRARVKDSCFSVHNDTPLN